MSGSTVADGTPCRPQGEKFPESPIPYCLEHGQMLTVCDMEREYQTIIKNLSLRVSTFEAWLGALKAALPHEERHAMGCQYCAWRATVHPEEFTA